MNEIKKLLGLAEATAEKEVTAAVNELHVAGRCVRRLLGLPLTASQDDVLNAVADKASIALRVATALGLPESATIEEIETYAATMKAALESPVVKAALGSIPSAITSA